MPGTMPQREIVSGSSQREGCTHPMLLAVWSEVRPTDFISTRDTYQSGNLDGGPGINV